MVDLKDNGLLGWIIGIVLVAIALIAMFPPQMSILKQASEYAVYIMLCFLFLSMLFMLLKKEKLMFLSLACTGILCLFLKGSSNANFIFPERNNQPTVSLAQINLSYIDQGYEELLKIIKDLDPEIISFQEVTPDWDYILKTNLSQDYVSKFSLVRIDPYGMAIYSKKMIANIDTFMYEEIPNISSEFRLNEETFNLVSSYLLPPLYSTSAAKSQSHLRKISAKLAALSGPIFALGDYNLVPWSPELRDFREKTGLLPSRRTIGVVKLQIPHDHIMHSIEMECINFQEIEDSRLNHIGIFGTYQLRSNRRPIAKIQ